MHVEFHVGKRLAASSSIAFEKRVMHQVEYRVAQLLEVECIQKRQSQMDLFQSYSYSWSHSLANLDRRRHTIARAFFLVPAARSENRPVHCELCHAEAESSQGVHRLLAGETLFRCRLQKLLFSIVLAIAGVSGCSHHDKDRLDQSRPAPRSDPQAVETGLVKESLSQRHMGLPWLITVFATDSATGQSAAMAAFREVARLNKVLSDYDSEAELFQLSDKTNLPHYVPSHVFVSEDLFQVLRLSIDFHSKTRAAFDPTVGPLTTLWRQSRRSGRMPVPEKLSAALESVGVDAIVLDAHQKSVLLAKPKMRLDFGGIGVGYAIDRAMDVLRHHGIRSAMIEASGDIAVSLPPPGQNAWRIAIAPLNPKEPSQEAILLVNAAITTSGDAFQAAEIDGIRYSHIVDPRTGLGTRGPTAVTVIAKDCTTADALATALTVLGHTEAVEILPDFEDVSARFVWMDGGNVNHFESLHWPQSVPFNQP